MKPYLKKIISSLSILASMVMIATLFAFPAQTFGADPVPLQPKLQIPIPQVRFSEVVIPKDTNEFAVNTIGEYIAGMYSYLVGIAGLLAITMIMYGGMKWIFAGGDSGKIGAAKEVITHAVIGLVLVLGSYLVLYTLNPELVRFESLKLLYMPRLTIVVDGSQASLGEAGIGTGSVPYFAQFDSAWGGKKPGDSDWPSPDPSRTCSTIIQRGCGTTSLAMVLKSYGISTDPFQTAKWGLGCTGGWQPSKTASEISTQWPGMVGEVIYKNEVNRVFELLRAGKPVIYNCKNCTGFLQDGTLQPSPYRGHFMVLTEIQADGKILVNDPGRNSNRRTAYFTEQQIRDQFNVAVYVHPQ